MFYITILFSYKFTGDIVKVLFLTKKKIMIIASCLASSSAAFILTLSNLFSPAKEYQKKLPIYNVERSEKIVSISFDAAWGNEQTEKLLNVLRENNVKTTFFLVGMWVDKYPESVKSIADNGHDIGNHSDTHPHLPKHTIP